MNNDIVNNGTYLDFLQLAKNTELNTNHGGWIISQDQNVKYTFDTLDEGRSFRVGKWEAGKKTGIVVRTVYATPEIEFLFTLRRSVDDN